MHLSARVGFIAETGGYLLSMPVIIYAGWLSDRYGRKPLNVLGNLAFLVLIYPTFAWIVATRTEFAFITGMIVLNVMSSITTGSFYASLIESLPKGFA